MKNKKLIIASLASLLIVSTVVVKTVSKKESQYQIREVNLEKQGQIISHAHQFYFDIKHNIETGEMHREDWLRAKSEVDAITSQNRSTLNWKEHGPDNVGGRTRAILIDRNDINHMYAGSVSGGLFESINRGNTWSKILSFEDNLSISSMCQTENGYLYVATGHSAETAFGQENSGANGNGVYFTKDNGVTWNLIAGTSSYNYINEVVAQSNDVYIATASGLKKFNVSSETITDVTGTTGACTALSISKDGTLIVASGTSNRTFISTDSGASFTDVSGPIGLGKIPPGAGRIEYAISHERASNGNYYIYASAANANLLGIYRSINNGALWEVLAPANNGVPGAFDPFDTGAGGQGTYDNIISVVPGKPDKIFVGGINIYSKQDNGNWEQKTQWFFPPQHPRYAHADQHEMQWDSEGRFWIGNDGGVGWSDDEGETYHPANRGFNVTQFYNIGFSAHGDVIGGSQDNGTQANYHQNHTYREHVEVGGGDGFACDISFINRNILFTSVYYGCLRRSGDRGFSSTSLVASNIPASFGTPCDLQNGLGSFYTYFKLYENPYDYNSTDSVVYVPNESYSIGEIVEIPSLTSQTFINYVTPINIVFQDTLNYNPSLTTQDTIVTSVIGINYNVNVLGYTFVYGAPAIGAGDTLDINGTIVVVASTNLTNHYYGTNPAKPGKVVDMFDEVVVYGVSWDTLKVQDHYQSWFAFGLGNGQGVWMTRNALRLSSTHDGFIKVTDGLNGRVTQMEFSADGNHLFIGTSSGRLYRLSGFGQVYSPNPKLGSASGNVEDDQIYWDNGHLATTLQEIANLGAYISGLSVNKNDANHLVVSLGNYGGTGKVRESTNALGVSPTFTSIQGNIPTMPCYSIVMDRDNPNIIMVGTEFGVWLTENGGTAWEYVSGDFGKVPVFDMGQNWRTWDEGNRKPGEIYIGTHGRGIWSTDSYLKIKENSDNLSKDKFVSGVNIFPNPVNDYGTIQFELGSENTNVQVQIFNLNGQMVYETNKSGLNEGVNQITFDTNDLSKGTYLVRIISGKEVKTAKFIKN